MKRPRYLLYVLVALLIITAGTMVVLRRTYLTGYVDSVTTYTNTGSEGRNQNTASSGTNARTAPPDTNATQTPPATNSFVAETPPVMEPVPEFVDRITKKPFGIYITPATSPVQPERFSGYHTGVDAEYDDTAEEVDVVAVADGTVIASQFVNGYGGVVIINHTIEDRTIQTLYGHLDPASLVAVDEIVEQGQPVGMLGEDQTSETDGERKHLHLSMRPEGAVSYRGYVSTEAELESWIDPLTYFK